MTSNKYRLGQKNSLDQDFRFQGVLDSFTGRLFYWRQQARMPAVLHPSSEIRLFLVRPERPVLRLLMRNGFRVVGQFAN